MKHDFIAELDEGQLDELLTYMPGFSKRNADNIKKLFTQKAASRSAVIRKISLRIVLVAAALFALSAATVFAAANGKLFFNRYIEQAEKSHILYIYENDSYAFASDADTFVIDTGDHATDTEGIMPSYAREFDAPMFKGLEPDFTDVVYNLEFTDYDEVRGYLNVLILNNEYMDNFTNDGVYHTEINQKGEATRWIENEEPSKGTMCVMARDDVPVFVQIWSKFLFGDFNCGVFIYMPLNDYKGSVPGLSAAAGFIDPGDINTSRHEYISEANGIEASFIINSKSNWDTVTTLLFMYEDVYYKIDLKYLWGTMGSGRLYDDDELYGFAVMIIDAFK
jgi:hypothetical protein